MRAWLCAVALGGCYAAKAPQGAPCDPQDPVCPENQACLLVGGSYICTSGPGTEVDAPSGDDAGGDAAGLRWTLVQTADSTTKSTNIAATGSGHAIIVALQTPSGNVVTAVADNANNTYARIPASRASVNNSDLASEIWYATNSHAGATVLTATATTLYSTVIWEVAGIKTTSPLDVASALSNQAATTTPLGASVTTTADGDFVIDVAMVNNALSGIHTGNRFTNDRGTNSNGWAHLTDPEAPAGTYRAQWDQPQSGVYCASSAAFFVGP
jgi:hypothetical protein